MIQNWELIANDPANLSFNDKGIALVEIKEKRICITKYRDQYFAFSAICPHASGRLDLGFIDALGNVVCPVHHYRYNIRTGRDPQGEGNFLKTYQVELRSGALWARV